MLKIAKVNAAGARHVGVRRWLPEFRAKRRRPARPSQKIIKSDCHRQHRIAFKQLQHALSEFQLALRSCG
jgi:hypothetical protein